VLNRSKCGIHSSNFELFNHLSKTTIMKKILMSLGFALSTIFGIAQPSQPVVLSAGATIEFEKDSHDFGQLKQHDDAIYEFAFTNTGSEPLIIADAKKSCGCTVPTFTREPIAPGETGVIHVKYDSKRVGPINKTVTIFSNAENSPTKILRIKGSIAAASVETAPVKSVPSGAPVAGQ
jgi:hypothetical protein